MKSTYSQEYKDQQWVDNTEPVDLCILVAGVVSQEHGETISPLGLTLNPTDAVGEDGTNGRLRIEGMEGKCTLLSPLEFLRMWTGRLPMEQLLRVPVLTAASLKSVEDWWCKLEAGQKSSGIPSGSDLKANDLHFGILAFVVGDREIEMIVECHTSNTVILAVDHSTTEGGAILETREWSLQSQWRYNVVPPRDWIFMTAGRLSSMKWTRYSPVMREVYRSMSLGPK